MRGPADTAGGGGVSTRGSYDRLWNETWGDMQRLGPVHRHQREAVVELVERLAPASVCDVGCGSGENLAAFACVRAGMALTGTDISEQALALARARVPAAGFFPLDIQAAHLPATFDLVTAIQVIEHLDDDGAAVRHMAKMARKWVLLTTMCGRMRRSERAIGHVRNYTPARLRELAESAGLEVLDIHGWGFPFYTPLYRTIVEWLPGGPPEGSMGRASRVAARALYHLYRLNLPRRGDVTTLLARPASAGPSAAPRLID